MLISLELKEIQNIIFAIMIARTKCAKECKNQNINITKLKQIEVKLFDKVYGV